VTVSNGRTLNYVAPEPVSIPAGLTLYATSSDVNVLDDACNPLPNSTTDLSKYLVIIRHTNADCGTDEKIKNAAAFGAKYFLFYHDKNEQLDSANRDNAVLVPYEDGVFLVQQGISQNLTLSFLKSSFILPVPNGGLMSSFSSYGPTNDMYFKPTISAPGSTILSTMPVPLGSYAILSGTSLSAPYVAGASALLLQIRGKTAVTAKAARSIFENNAVPVKASTSNTALIETASHQGAALIQVYNAAKNTGSMLPAELLLNDTAYFKCVHELSITNGGKRSVTYSLNHVPAGTAITMTGIETNRESRN
jgi:subtilisin family serine protease